MTLFSIPEPPPVPPYLRWDLADAIDHDDPATFAVMADVTQHADGWRWIARVWRYTNETRDLVELVGELTGEPPRRVRGLPATKAGCCDTRQKARAAAETWIREQVAALRVSLG